MTQDNARLTNEEQSEDNSRLNHARYQVGEFKSDNSGSWYLPNGADRQFIEHINSIPSMNAKFYHVRGDVMVSCIDDDVDLGESDPVPKIVEYLASEYDMVRTNNFTSPNTTTFEYRPDRE
jgi:hypothetical protein